jgi:mRNA interferase HicA
MKTRDLIKKLEKSGWTFKRRGSNHDVYNKGNARESVPSHSETDEELAKAIIKRRSL